MGTGFLFYGCFIWDIVECEYVDSYSPELEKVIHCDEFSIMQLNIRELEVKKMN